MIIVELEEQIDYYELHPPSALAGMGTTPLDEVDWDWTVRDDTANSVFLLACRCGNTMFEASCWVDAGQVTPPISVLCTSCGYQHVIFDPNVHGYDAILGDDDEPFTHGPGAHLAPLGCDEVAIPNQIIVRFEYPSEVLADGEHEGQEHDLFTMITILAVDPETDEIGLLFEEDCS